MLIHGLFWQHFCSDSPPSGAALAYLENLQVGQILSWMELEHIAVVDAGPAPPIHIDAIRPAIALET